MCNVVHCSVWIDQETYVESKVILQLQSLSFTRVL